MTDVLTGVIGGGGFGLMPYATRRNSTSAHTLTAIDIDWFMPLDRVHARGWTTSRGW